LRSPSFCFDLSSFSLRLSSSCFSSILVGIISAFSCLISSLSCLRSSSSCLRSSSFCLRSSVACSLDSMETFCNEAPTAFTVISSRVSSASDSLQDISVIEIDLISVTCMSVSFPISSFDIESLQSVFDCLILLVSLSLFDFLLDEESEEEDDSEDSDESLDLEDSEDFCFLSAVLGASSYISESFFSLGRSNVFCLFSKACVSAGGVTCFSFCNGDVGFSKSDFATLSIASFSISCVFICLISSSLIISKSSELSLTLLIGFSSGSVISFVSAIFTFSLISLLVFCSVSFSVLCSSFSSFIDSSALTLLVSACSRSLTFCSSFVSFASFSSFCKTSISF